MNTDAAPEEVVPSSEAETSLHKGAEPTDARRAGPVSKMNYKRPKSILALFEYAYGEEGRKLSLARRDLRELSVESDRSQAELNTVRELAAHDPFLAVPPSLLATVAELGADPTVRRRILDLILVAFASHSLFEGKMERLIEPTAQLSLSAHEVSEAAKKLTFDSLGLKEASQFKEATRDRLRVNAVTAFELFRALRDGWALDRYIEDMSSLVWDVPIQRNAPKAAALLASVKNTAALSQLARHFEVLLRDSKRETDEAREQTAQQARRAETLEAANRSMTDDLVAERSRVVESLALVSDLTQRLAAEQSSRVIDKSHLVDDFEALRTQVIRRLTAQVELLSDGLHALRSGSTAVAEEFVDRALSAIDGEVTYLKDIDKGPQ